MTKEKMLEVLESKKKFQRDLDAFLSAYMSGDERKELQAVIAGYYAQKATAEMDRLAAERGWTQETYDGWLKEHNRTPYQ